MIFGIVSITESLISGERNMPKVEDLLGRGVKVQGEQALQSRVSLQNSPPKIQARLRFRM